MSVATLPPRSNQSSEQSPEEVWPEWLVPPEDGYFAEDLDRLPGLPAHTELLNGSLVFVSPHALWHARVITALFKALELQLPADWNVVQTFTVRLGPRDRPEPDLVVATAESVSDDTRTWVAPEDVRLVVEVESPESRIRDREVKSVKYAEAGIEHYWRIQRDADQRSLPEVHLYELDQTGRYREASVQRGRVIARLPFLIDIDLAGLG
jgi:Uma2 family endonuclease